MGVYRPDIIRMSMLLEELNEEPLRAAYMVIQQLHELQTGSVKKLERR